jgi:hypothetical protein
MAAKVDDADLSVARFNIDINDTAANIQKALTFVTSFRGALDALNTGSGFDINKSIIGKAQSDATALFGQIKDFLDTTTKLFPRRKGARRSRTRRRRSRITSTS